MAERTPLDLIQSILTQAGIQSILIGGFAVIHYGYQRATQDLDLMISEEDLSKVKEVLEKEGFAMTKASSLCAKFKKSGFGLEAVDFVLVAPPTFHKIMQGGHSVAISGKDFIVPSLEHLISMKLHAIKQDPKERIIKDLADIAHLIQIKNIDPRSNTVRDLCLKFGTQEIYDKLLVFFPE